jgi:hypothetical protein
MNSGVQEQFRLINTLKRLVGNFDDPVVPYEKKIHEYLNMYYEGLQKLESGGDFIYLMTPDAISKMYFYPKEGVLKFPSKQFLNLKKLFSLDEDTLEEVIKNWLDSKFNLRPKFIDYFNQ